MSNIDLFAKDLPQYWIWTTIEDILLSLESGGRPKGGVKHIKEGIPSIGGEHLLYDGGFDFSEIKYVPKEFYEKMNKGKIQKDDVLVVKDGATTGKTAFVSDSFSFKDAAVNEHVYILRTLKEITEPKYLLFWMQSSYGQKCVKDNFQGTAQGGINSFFVRNSNFPLPPLPEQGRIVAKIEELFTKLDAGVEALKKIKAQLKRYRQAVLKYAFEGKLTEEWREAHKPELEPASVFLEKINAEGLKMNVKQKRKLKDEIATAAKGDLAMTNLPELPEGWQYLTLNEIVAKKKHSIMRGPFGSSIKKAFFVPVGYKVYEQQNVIYNNFDVGDYYINESKYNELRNFAVQSGDILMSCSGTIGALAIVPKNAKAGIINQALLKITPDNCVVDTYYFMNLFRFKINVITRENTRGSAMLNISSVKDLKKIPVPIPSLVEQHQIVSEIERRLSQADAIEKVVDQSLKQTEQLRHSILKRAFEGQLVAQDPNDEPAEKLLERIKSEKANTEESNKKKGKKLLRSARIDKRKRRK